MSQDNDSDCEDMIGAEYVNPEILVVKKKPSIARKSLDEILREAVSNNIVYEIIKNGSKMRSITSTKAAYAKSAWERGYSMQEIACHINVSPVAVFKYINRKS